MSERYIVIRNWDKFQHKDIWRKSGGSPPWIKNYTALLHDDDYLGLSWAQRGILHGLWLMYASAGRALNENRSRTLLSRNKGESRHFQGHLEALSDAGFIEFVAQPIRAPVAPRVEERREEPPQPPLEGGASRSHSRKDLRRYTGCRYVYNGRAPAYVRDPLGTDKRPEYWQYPPPTTEEILEALAEQETAHA